MMRAKERMLPTPGKQGEFTTRVKVLVVAMSLLGLAVLYQFALESRSPLVPLSQLEGHLGETVRVRGRLTQLDYLPGGAVKLELREDNASCWVFLESPGEEFWLDPGDLVEAEGELREYQGDLELMVEGEEQLLLLERGRGLEVFLSTLSRLPWNYLDSPVTVSGELRYNVSLYDPPGELALFYITDGAGMASLKVKLLRGEAAALVWERALGLQAGQAVRVTATLRYSHSDMRYYLSLEGETAWLEPPGAGALG